MAELKNWDTTAANNNDAAPDGAPEGMAPSGVNDVIRENMAVLARHKGDNDGSLDSGGSSNAYTLTPNGTYSAYTRGDTFTFEANHANTGAATLNVSSLGAQAIVHMNGTALIAGEIQSGGVYTVYYDGTQFLIGNPSLQTSALTLDYANGRAGFQQSSPDEPVHSGTRVKADEYFYTRKGTTGSLSASGGSEVLFTGTAGDVYLVSATNSNGTVGFRAAAIVLFSDDSSAIVISSLSSNRLALTDAGSLQLELTNNGSGAISADWFALKLGGQ